jgi:IS5 family transposase
VKVDLACSREGTGWTDSRYKNEAGIERWGGLRIIADNLINIGRAMAK